MFGKRTRPPVGIGEPSRRGPAPVVATPANKRESGCVPLGQSELSAVPASAPATLAGSVGMPSEKAPAAQPPTTGSGRSDSHSAIKSVVVRALLDVIDPAVFARLDAESKGEEIRDLLCETIAMKNIVMTIAEQEELLDDICNQVLADPSRDQARQR